MGLFDFFKKKPAAEPVVEEQREGVVEIDGVEVETDVEKYKDQLQLLHGHIAELDHNIEILNNLNMELRGISYKEVDKNRLKFGGLEINLSNYSVSYNGKSLEFPPKEFELLSFLAQHPNRVFTREQLLDRIWGYEYVGDTRTVDVHVKRIREKLNSEDEWGIRTVWSVGYKFGQK